MGSTAGEQATPKREEQENDVEQRKVRRTLALLRGVLRFPCLRSTKAAPKKKKRGVKPDWLSSTQRPQRKVAWMIFWREPIDAIVLITLHTYKMHSFFAG